MRKISQLASAACMMSFLFLAAGCAQQGSEPAPGQTGGETETSTAGVPVDDHSGWWCNAHGVPEEECGLCNSALAADLQRAGDWCKDHDRPDSQCFACHPELEVQFAARYEARYGKQPPKPEG